MPVYERSPATELHVVDEWSGGFGWMAHPEEDGERVSHAVEAPDGVWVFDPIDAPGLDERLAELGDVTGVAVLSAFHSRDAGTVANRHDVAVHVPRWMNRVEERVDAPVVRYDGDLVDSGFHVHRFESRILPGWQEGIAYRESDGTLRIPDLFSTSAGYAVGDERMGVALSHRLFPPRDPFADVEPERILFGHGEGIMDGATEALRDAVDNAWRRLPRAMLTELPTNLRLVVAGAKG